MKAPKPVFVCQECGSQQPKWQGRCPDCGAWNSFVEERPIEVAAPVAAAGHRYAIGAPSQGAIRYAEIEAHRSERLGTGIGVCLIAAFPGAPPMFSVPVESASSATNTVPPALTVLSLAMVSVPVPPEPM